jgi:hypothetical protein
MAALKKIGKKTSPNFHGNQIKLARKQALTLIAALNQRN